ncbi:MAG: PRC-barrel domain containing protein [Actinomycetota bacterium]|nr:PRC-barrel domain containing protein [Actinomycetota bacterium]
MRSNDDGPLELRDLRPIAAGDVDLSGFEVMGRDGSIGIVDKATNKMSASYLVVDTGDWHPDHQVILPAATVERIDPEKRVLFVDRTRKEVEEAPDVTPEKIRTASFQDRLSGYYHGLYDTGL